MVFGKGLFHSRGQNSFFDFADIGQFGSQQKVFGHLLGNGRSTGRTASGADVFQIAENGANDTDVINPRMAVKLFVFCSDKGIFDLIGNLVNRNENTFFNRIFHQQLTVAGVKPRGDGRFIFGQLVVIRQLAGIFPQRTDNQHDGDDGKEKKRTQQGRQGLKHYNSTKIQKP